MSASNSATPAPSPVHVLRTDEHEQRGDHCQTTRDAEGAGCNVAAPPNNRAPQFMWAEIWARSEGRTVKGHVPAECLE